MKTLKMTLFHWTNQHQSSDVWMGRFTLCGLLLGLLATTARFVLSIHFFFGNTLQNVADIVGILFFLVLTLRLWSKPQTVKSTLLILYLALTWRLTLQLVLLLVFHDVGMGYRFIWMSSWMSVDYVLSFLIFQRAVAVRFAVITLLVWLVLSVTFALTRLQAMQSSALLVLLSQIFTAQGFLIGFMLMFARLQTLYTSSRETVREMERLATTDTLLRIPNRRAVELELEKAFQRASEEASPLSLIFIDVDHFKQVNDQHGHRIGDKVLIDVTHVIRNFMTPLGYFGRWGGEEFVVILPHANAELSHQIAEQTRRYMETHSFPVGKVTASFGVAEYRPGDSLESLIERADEALYRGKALGRNQVVVAN